MEFIALGILGLAIFGFFIVATDDRKEARKAGEPTGSLLWHFQQRIAKDKAKKNTRKDAKLAKKQQNYDGDSSYFPPSPAAEPAPEEPSPNPKSADKRSPLEPLTTTEQAPIGPWQAVDSALVEFEYQSEEEPIAIYAARVCDTHIAGALEGENFDAVEREYAFSGFKSAVTLPLEDSLKVPVDQLRGYLLANYPDDDSDWEEELPPKDVESAPSSTGNLRFVYRDADGNESTRELTNFKMSAGKVRGICLDRNAIRTFRLERIVEFLEGEEQLYETKATPPPRPEMQDFVRSGDPEITFSGFDAKTLSELEKTAKAHGFVVRKSVTKNLDYFVAGPRRSAVKVTEAEDKPGCTVIDKEGFLWLLGKSSVNGAII